MHDITVSLTQSVLFSLVRKGEDNTIFNHILDSHSIKFRV